MIHCRLPLTQRQHMNNLAQNGESNFNSQKGSKEGRSTHNPTITGELSFAAVKNSEDICPQNTAIFDPALEKGKLNELLAKSFSNLEGSSKFLDKLASPHQNRSAYRLPPQASKQRITAKDAVNEIEKKFKVTMPVFNSRTRIWKNEKRSYVRGQDKDPEHEYIKKTPLSLIPRDFKIELYKAEKEHDFGLFFDLQKVKLKKDDQGVEKFCFLFDACSEEKWWHNYESDSEPPKIGHRSLKSDYLISYPLTELVSTINDREKYLKSFEVFQTYAWYEERRQKLIDGGPICHTEIIACPNLQSVIGIYFFPSKFNSLKDKQSTFEKALHFKEVYYNKFKNSLPIYMFDYKGGVIKKI